MPFYGGTRRVLLSAPNDPFLPSAGPLLGVFSPTKASSVPSLTVSSTSNIPHSRRATPLKYNNFIVNSGKTWSRQDVDSCLFLSANIGRINGTINMNGGDGGSAFDNTGANGGSGGASGGGGGGGGTQCGGCGAVPGSFGSGGYGANGDPGQTSTVCCSGYASGGPGGVGYASNWSSDGYNYVSNLGFDPQGFGFPYGRGGDGFNGDGSGGGGGGAGAGGLCIMEFNYLYGASTASISAQSGNSGQQTPGNPTILANADGGGIFIFTRHYDGLLNGKINVSGQSGGNSGIWKINDDNSITAKSFATPF